MEITFKELDLKPEILDALDLLGFERPTPIQGETIPYLLAEETDLIGLAQTGTGKTAAFSLPILNQIDPDDSTVQALILSPTRELCLQICRDLEAFSKKMKRTAVVAVYGGANIREQIRALRNGAQIVVGTPGRTLDLIKRNRLKLQDARFLVLDEADEMLTMGFKETLDAILEATPDAKQTILFSATMPRDIRRIAQKYMNEPKEISVITEQKSTANVSHEYYMTLERNRYLALKRLADYNPNQYSIVFCRTRRETQLVADKLMGDGYSADSLHGDLSQAQRDLVMQRFRDKKIQMLVATDVAARGIDVDDLTHVINYNLPDSLEAYVHRSGRTGRANKTGICMTIINAREGGRIRQVERKIERKIERKEIPNGPEICRRRMLNLIDEVEKVEVREDQINEFLEEFVEKLSGLTREELIARFISVEFKRFLEYYKNAQDLNVRTSRGRDRDRNNGMGRRERGGRNRRDRGAFSRYFINLGKEQNLSPGELITLINQTIPGQKLDIGQIELQKNFSFFEIEKGFEPLILKSFKTAKFRGRKVNVEIANPKPERKYPKGKKKKKKR